MKRWKVYNGIDRVETAKSFLQGRRLGLLTSASGINRSGIPTSEILSEYGHLSYLFSPEHGFYANLQDGLYGKDSWDPETGAAICDAGLLANPDDARVRAIFENLDTAVYDIQDVGARFYTYLYNLTDLMQCCQRYGKPLIVLDRINPIGGVRMDGAILDVAHFSSGIGRYAIPTRYAMTPGELARFVNAEGKIGCDLTVIPCEGWRRDVFYDETDLPWVNPSPNIPSVGTALNYIGSCIFEATNVSEGRGTTRPFDMVGAPFVDVPAFYREMTDHQLPGVVFRKAYFTPGFQKYAGQTCGGLEMLITDREAYDPIRTMLYMLAHLRRYEAFTCRPDGFAIRFGTNLLADPNYDTEKFCTEAAEANRAFRKKAETYWLYA